MNNIFVYKLTNDSGGAPCLRNGLLSLAICKPMIRKSAKEGDLVFGFAASSLRQDNALIYIARITDSLANGQYYTKRKYSQRGDCIYRRSGDRFVRKRSAKFHDSIKDLTRDLGEYPAYPKATVLLSRDFRYFGNTADDTYKRHFPRIKSTVDRLGRGHRVRLDGELRRELCELTKWVWRSKRRMVLGRPTSAPRGRACLRGGTCCVV